MINLNAFLVLGAVVFCIGLFGALSKRNAVAILMSIEIMLNAVNITLVAYASAFIRYTGAAGHGERLTGQVFAIFIITVAAAEAAVALAMIIAIYRRRATIDVGEINLMRW